MHDKDIVYQILDEKKCVNGCKRFSGGELRHHKSCPNYPESFSEMFDILEDKKSVKVKDKPVLVQSCKHGKVFQITALSSSQLSLDEIFTDLNPHDIFSIVPLSDCPKLMSCKDCDF